jgi:hypothetical protein
VPAELGGDRSADDAAGGDERELTERDLSTPADEDD